MLIGDAVFAESGVQPNIHKNLLPQASKGKKRTFLDSTSTSKSTSMVSSRAKRAEVSVDIGIRPTSQSSRSVRGEIFYDAQEEESHPGRLSAADDVRSLAD